MGLCICAKWLLQVKGTSFILVYLYVVVPFNVMCPCFQIVLIFLKDILCEDNTILCIMWSKTSPSFWMRNQNFITRFQGLETRHQFTIVFI